MSIPLGLAVNDVLFPIVGAAFLALIGLVDSLGVGIRLLGLSYLTGWALLGVVLSLGLVLGLPLTVPSVVIVAAALTLICALAAGRRWFAPLGPRAPARSRLDAILSRIGAVALAVGAFAALVIAVRGQWNSTDDFDAFFFWLPKAETIYVAHGLDPALWRQFIHVEYPPLMPAMIAVTFAFTGGFHPSLLPFQQALLGLSFVLAALALLDRFVPRRLSVPILALLATAPWFWAKLESVMPDQTLAYLIAIAALASLVWLLEPRPAFLALALVLLAAGSLTKLEGMLSALTLAVVMLAAGLARFRRGGLQAAVLLLGPGVILIWRAWLRAHGLRGSSPDYALSNVFNPSFLDERAHRLRFALSAMANIAGHLFGGAMPIGGFVFAGQVEAGVFLAALAVLLVFVGRSAPVIAATVAGWLVLAFAGLATIYWIGRIPVHQYVAETVQRVEETPAIVTLTLLPLLLALAFRLAPVPAGQAADAGSRET